MTTDEVMKELAAYGDAQTKKTLMTHGAQEPLFGVKVADLKKILKKTKKNHELSLALFATGNSDAMYLAGLIADEKKISKAQLEEWAEKAYWSYLSEYAVPWVASETPFGFELGLNWIKSDKSNVAVCGWGTLSSCAALHPDTELDIEKYSQLLDLVAKEIHTASNRERYCMNGFVITVGSFIKVLTDTAIATANKIGKVTVDMNGTACKVPLATDYIKKIVDKGQVGKKRKTARC